MKLPVRATEDFRAKAGEFLHRLNCNAKRKFWELDYDDGEIILSAYADMLIAPLYEEHFKELLHSMITTADITLPYLTSVICGRMTPSFAADQADAAIQAHWENGANPDTEEDEQAWEE